MKRKASAVWKGGLVDGNGTFSLGSGLVRDGKYSFKTRFEESPGSNPEELVAAAHASCFAMALSFILGNGGITPESVSVDATVTLDKDGEGFSVTESHLVVVARIPGCDKAKFDEAASAAKAGCPISKLLNCKITMDAKLEA